MSYTIVTREFGTYCAEELTGFLKYQAGQGRLVVIDSVKKKFLGRKGEWEDMGVWSDPKTNDEKRIYAGVSF